MNIENALFKKVVRIHLMDDEHSMSVGKHAKQGVGGAHL